MSIRGSRNHLKHYFSASYTGSSTAKRGFLSLSRQRCSARPLLLPPRNGAGPIELSAETELDLDAVDVPTIAVIGPSRRGKSVLCSLLSGGDPGLFKQSHSSFRAMTNGTHISELTSSRWMPEGARIRIVDTEGLSHVGRSRGAEALVRQFLISTYLTSSWVVWLDSDVLSSGFFNMMWLVHDYVADVLRVRDMASGRLPSLMYLRTQETEVQRREYENDFRDFGAFFESVLNDHEDAHILKRMFAPRGLHGAALPVWTVQDLESYERGQFWSAGYASPFKSAIDSIGMRISSGSASATDSSDKERNAGQPLLALSSLGKHLAKISRLEAFDPRDNEATKVLRLRAHLYGKYGRDRAGETPTSRAVWLADLFDPADPEVKRHAGDLEAVFRARMEAQCKTLHLDMEIGVADSVVREFATHFHQASMIFRSASAAFAQQSHSDRGILRSAIVQWRLDPDIAEAALLGEFEEAKNRFLAQTCLPQAELKSIGLLSRLRWRIDDCMRRLRSIAPGGVLVEGNEQSTPQHLTPVWYLGEWDASAHQSGKALRAKTRSLALWTDGFEWVLYQEPLNSKAHGPWVVQESGRLSSKELGGNGPLPDPSLVS
eukprot:TRINITY_DN44167_c0_g1_i1.p1 TRINITY_DN44167_c0_g1~~TRINITY_DN44167_c0_g1_i1.p1  ORF type:complete len:604 (+),score=65.48 TRINITY_DN44167_c0_g1_i1:126-1937(+)